MYSVFQLAKKYCSYYLNASNGKGHGVHSPFVFDFIKFVKNDRRQYDCYASIEALRADLLQNKNFIAVEDFGAGSTVLKTNRRAIHKMAQSSLKPKKFAQLLFRIVQYYRPKAMLELGTSFGITSSYLASGNLAGQLYTLEGSPAIAAIAKDNFDKLQLSNIHLEQGDFAKTLQPLLTQLPQIDLAFVDGNHRKAPTLQYFHSLLANAGEQSIFIFDDIHWSEEM
ncbi:MAG: SAM-dependent methyltransferase, partial [Chitinophagaceae bacterium]